MGIKIYSIFNSPFTIDDFLLMVHHKNKSLSSKKDESKKSDEAACLRPQRKGFPTGRWVERGRRYAAEESPILLATYLFLRRILPWIIHESRHYRA